MQHHTGFRSYLVITALMIGSWVFCAYEPITSGTIESQHKPRWGKTSTTYTLEDDPFSFFVTLVFQKAPWVVGFSLLWLLFTCVPFYQWWHRRKLRLLSERQIRQAQERASNR